MNERRIEIKLLYCKFLRLRFFLLLLKFTLSTTTTHADELKIAYWLVCIFR